MPLITFFIDAVISKADFAEIVPSIAFSRCWFESVVVIVFISAVVLAVVKKGNRAKLQ